MRLMAVLAVFVWAGLDTVSWAQQTPTSPARSGPRVEAGQRATSGVGGTRASSSGRRPGRGGQDVTVVSGSRDGAAPRVSGGGESFEPIMSRRVAYGSVPDFDEEVTLSLAGPMPATEFLDALAVATNWNIAASPDVKQQVLEFWTNDISPKQAVAILRFNDMFYEFDDESNFLFVMMRDEYIESEYGGIVEREFAVEYAGLSDVEIVLASLLSSRGRLIADPRTSKVLVLDTFDNIEHMERVVREMDQPRDTRAFPLVHANAEALVQSIEAVLTESGQLSVDARSNTLVVTDRAQRLARIGEVIELLDRELQTRSWVLDYADPVAVAENLGLLVPDAMGSIVVNEAIHQITVTATANRLNEIDSRIQAWDEKRRQVQIEAYLATASASIMRDLGINWSYMTSIDGDPLAVEVGSVGTDDGSGGIDLGPLIGSQRISFFSDHLSAVIDMLDTSADATILAHPRITVQDGEEAVFENTTQVPFASSTTTFGGNNASIVNTNTQIQFIDVGTIMRVIPRITSDLNILLDISAEDSSFESVTIFANGKENTLPQKTQNKAETQVLVRSEETIVLGGLRTTNFTDNVDRVPILGGLPIIGRAFRSTEKDHLDRELLIFLTPTIVGEETQPEATKLAAFDDSVAETMRDDAKTTLGRLKKKLSKGKNEIGVSIGQSGGLLADGGPVTMEELRELIAETSHPSSRTVIIREHPRAPESIATEIAELAMERGMKVDFDDRRFPFVPSTAN